MKFILFVIVLNTISSAPINSSTTSLLEYENKILDSTFNLISNVFSTIKSYNPFNGEATFDLEFGSGGHIKSNTNYNIKAKNIKHATNSNKSNNIGNSVNNYGSGGHLSPHPCIMIKGLELDIHDKMANLIRSKFEIDLMRECEFYKGEDEEDDDNDIYLESKFFEQVDNKDTKEEKSANSRQGYVSPKAHSNTLSKQKTEALGQSKSAVVQPKKKILRSTKPNSLYTSALEVPLIIGASVIDAILGVGFGTFGTLMIRDAGTNFGL